LKKLFMLVVYSESLSFSFSSSIFPIDLHEVILGAPTLMKWYSLLSIIFIRWTFAVFSFPETFFKYFPQRGHTAITGELS